MKEYRTTCFVEQTDCVTGEFETPMPDGDDWELVAQSSNSILRSSEYENLDRHIETEMEATEVVYFTWGREKSDSTEKKNPSDLCVCRFYQDFGRMGHLSGVFLATRADVEKCIGKTVRFGEVLGKHSDIRCKLTTENITIGSDDPRAVTLVQQLGLCDGVDPIQTIKEIDEGADALGS